MFKWFQNVIQSLIKSSFGQSRIPPLHCTKVGGSNPLQHSKMSKVGQIPLPNHEFKRETLRRSLSVYQTRSIFISKDHHMAGK